VKRNEFREKSQDKMYEIEKKERKKMKLLNKTTFSSFIYTEDIDHERHRKMWLAVA
jgi:hypothetical protein